MKLICLFALVLTAGLGVSGCQSVDSPTDRIPLGYAPARLYDFMDIFELNAGFDLTFDNIYGVVAIEPIAVGGGYYDSEKLGMDGRLFGRWKETRTEIGFIIDCLVHYEKTPRRGNRYLFDDLYSPYTSSKSDEYVPFKEWGLSHRLFDMERNPLDITAELYLFFIGLDVGVSPQEILDFVLGIFTFDGISDDDYENPRGWCAEALARMEGEPESSELTIVLAEPPTEESTLAVEEVTAAPPDPEFMTISLDSAAPTVAAAAPTPEPEATLAMMDVPQEEPEMTISMTSVPQEEPEMTLTMESVPREEPEMVITMENAPVEGPASAVTPVPIAVSKPVLSPEGKKTIYNDKFEQTEFRDPSQLVSLAKWCQDNDMQRKTTWHLRQAIALDPNNAEARRMLGFEWRDNRWVYASGETNLYLTISAE
jgi:hypothetical protein